MKGGGGGKGREGLVRGGEGGRLVGGDWKHMEWNRRGLYENSHGENLLIKAKTFQNAPSVWKEYSMLVHIGHFGNGK